MSPPAAARISREHAERQNTRNKLTNKQRKYVRELREIFAILNLDFESVRDDQTAKERTAHLKRILVHVIRGEVITQFTLIDELLTHELAGKILADRVKHRRPSKRFQTVKAALAESRLSLPRKLALLRSFVRVPDDVVAQISRLTKLRNHMAHHLVLDDSAETLKYSGKNIFSVEGLQLFYREQSRVVLWYCATLSPPGSTNRAFWMNAFRYRESV